MELTLVKKDTVARDTTSFTFTRPGSFTFDAGQYIYVTLPKLSYPDSRGEVRHFTISSSPTETGYLTLTTRIREESGYKKTLNELPVGTTVVARGPQGFFVINERKTPLSNNVFLAGGIGITPFRSIIKYEIDRNLNIPINLIYSNSDSDFIFKSDLDQWDAKSDNLKINYFDSSKEGHLDLPKITNLLGAADLTNTTFWVVGPNAFVNSMEEILANMNILEDNIKTEKFTGY